jgi:hypothetical protein
VIKNSYAHNANESKVYAGLVWGPVLIGIIVLLAGSDQPILLLVISALVGGFMTFIYSGLLILINRKSLPGAIKIRGVRLVALIWAIALFRNAIGADLPRPARQAVRRLSEHARVDPPEVGCHVGGA